MPSLKLKNGPALRGSMPEIAFAVQLEQAHIEGFVREFPFHPKRLWRADFADAQRKIIVEIDGSGPGGVGKHGYASGRAKDNEKRNEAVCMGWRVLIGTTAQAENGQLLAWLLRILE